MAWGGAFGRAGEKRHDARTEILSARTALWFWRRFLPRPRGRVSRGTYLAGRIRVPRDAARGRRIARGCRGAARDSATLRPGENGSVPAGAARAGGGGVR